MDSYKEMSYSEFKELINSDKIRYINAYVFCTNDINADRIQITKFQANTLADSNKDKKFYIKYDENSRFLHVGTQSYLVESELGE